MNPSLALEIANVAIVYYIGFLKLKQNPAQVEKLNLDPYFDELCQNLQCAVS